MAKYTGDGTVLKLFYSAAFNAIGQITSINGPNIAVDTADSTSFDSTASAGGNIAREFLLGLVDFGEVNVTIQFDAGSAGHQAVLDIVGDPGPDAPTTNGHKIQLTESDTGNTVWPDDGVPNEWRVYLTSYTNERSLGEAVTADITFKTTGALATPT